MNDVKEGKTEAKLIKAPFGGTVAIGIKDVNGSYDDSINKQSSFTLNVEKVNPLPEDESSLESPIKIKSLPFNQENLYITGEKGDSDYFHFTSKEAQFIKFDVTGIPGVDISAGVYDKDQLFPPIAEGEETQLPIELPEGEEIPKPNPDEMPTLYSANSGGIGEGETLSFQTEPEKEYYVKVTNKISIYDYKLEDILSNPTGILEEKEPAQSALPYRVSLVGKVIPADEDNYSGMMPTTEEENIIRALQEQNEEERIALLESMALPYEIGGTVKGYLQNNMDQDWYILKPTNAGIYQFDVPTPATNMPIVELYEIVEGEDADGKPYKYLAPVSNNIDWNGYEAKNGFLTGLKANKTYFLAVNPNYMTGQIPYDGYEITSKLLIQNAGDAYEDNELPEQAKDLPAAGAKANFAVSNDVDTYYFTAKETTTYGVKFARTPLTAALKNKYSEELLSPFYGYVMITEDVNKNRKAEETEYERTRYMLNITENGTTTGSFKAKKGQSYFVTVNGIIESSARVTLWPYQFNIQSVSNKDENPTSKVKNHTPTKPLAMKKINSKSYTGTASFNTGFENGDEDWFVYKAAKTEQATLTLDGGTGIDGVIEVYRNGKRIAASDYYGTDDNEVLSLTFTKGTYYIKVRDRQGHASFAPYTLSVKLK